ncbi:GntR family transcriptional regulator [Microbacterium marinilacus]|uniref:GntR family transcriptional regulator n=1 Tax=Microbacterium marinilacus TaxID=415209 RepID=A0ABP7BMD5_9MICO|nr:GntR family transcriptional regulator [Microbacterium marinilacus]MBY0690490.1 GntR family transcriptional regulator [Microbacterium marinilacus]
MTTESAPGLPARIAHHLREQIITGEIPMGSRLNERDIAEQLQVSRVPVREALPILEAEGFATSRPRRGSVVHTFTLADAREVFDLRRQLEPLAAGFAAKRAAAGADTTGVREALESAAEVAADLPPSTRNSDLHDEIMTLSGHALLQRMSGLLSGRVRWLFRLTPERDTPSMWQEHSDIVSAIVAGQHDLATMLMAAHVERAAIESLPLLEGRLPAEAPAPRRRRATA